MAGDDTKYHIGFGRSDLPDGTTIALLSGDPGRSELIAIQLGVDADIVISTDDAPWLVLVDGGLLSLDPLMGRGWAGPTSCDLDCR